MVLSVDELWRLSLVSDRHHAAVALEVEPTVLTEDGLVGTSVVPVIRGLSKTVTTDVETVRVCARMLW